MVLTATDMFAQSSADILAYVDKYKQIALDQERQYGIPAPITLAQGILESGAGKTVIVRQTVNNAPTFDADCQMDDEEQSEEEQTVTQAVTRYVVEINDISCTILYPGTTLSSIAMQYDIPKDQLLDFNEVVVEEELHEGDIVFLDKKKKKYEGAKDFHYVKEGETLYSVSQEYGIKVANLAKMNRMDISEKLYEGTKLILK